MSRRTHFWLRIAGIAVIVAVQVVPRFFAKDYGKDHVANASESVHTHAAVAQR
jgi:hypothetical protein